MSRPDVSVVVPLFNEQDSVRPLVAAVRHALGSGETWELILVDDGSTDDTAAIGRRLADADGRVRLLPLARNYGQTPAMQAGLDHARAPVIVTMDGDLQNDPADIPRLVSVLRTEGCDLVAGFRVRRQDSLLTRKIPSWIANRIIRWITGVNIRDNGCSLKAYRRDLIPRMRLYSDMHRFIPAVAAATAGAAIVQVPVTHHPRRYGTSKYGLGRTFRVVGDLLTIKMIRSFRGRPLLLFGTGAALATSLGAGFLSAALLDMSGATGRSADPVVFPAAALLWLGLGGYLLMLGLIAESAVRDYYRTAAELPSLARDES